MKEIPFTTEVLRSAYSQGFFPMPDPIPGSEQILWYNPDPRAIIPLDGFHCSKSLKKTINKNIYSVTFDKAFAEVMKGCADRRDTWIDGRFVDVYSQLHKEGNAHSVEVWRDAELVGGLYGVCFGGAFFAESKFHRQTDASKIALYYLIEHMRENGFLLLEVQFLTKHLASLGAIVIPAVNYLELLAEALEVSPRF